MARTRDDSLGGLRIGVERRRNPAVGIRGGSGGSPTVDRAARRACASQGIPHRRRRCCSVDRALVGSSAVAFATDSGGGPRHSLSEEGVAGSLGRAERAIDFLRPSGVRDWSSRSGKGRGGRVWSQSGGIGDSLSSGGSGIGRSQRLSMGGGPQGPAIDLGVGEGLRSTPIRGGIPWPAAVRDSTDPLPMLAWVCHLPH